MKIARSAFASTVEVIATAIILFVLYRIILEFLGAEGLGVWSIVLATASASRVGELGMSASVTRFVAKYRAEENQQAVAEVLQTAAVTIAVLLTLLVLPLAMLLQFVFERVFDGDSLGLALEVLPLALLSLILTSVAAVWQSGLDGWQRFDKRAVLVIATQLIYLLLAASLIPSFGLVGLAWAQVIQSGLLLGGGWLLLRRTIGTLPSFPFVWRASRFREMLGYGSQMQLISLALLLFDPLTKALIGMFGGLSAAGYFEMARQLVSKVRHLLIAANQVIVPVVAGFKRQEQLTAMYRANVQLLLTAAIPLYGLLSAWAPLVSELWIGNFEAQFVQFVIALCLGLGVNTLSGPAYFSMMGTGNVLWNTVAHLWMGLANLAAGVLLGPKWGAAGVVAGMTFANVTASALVVVGFHRRHRLGYRMFVSVRVFVLMLSAVATVSLTHYAYAVSPASSVTVRYALCVILPAAAFGALLWHHPARVSVQASLVRALRGKVAAQ